MSNPMPTISTYATKRDAEQAPALAIKKPKASNDSNITATAIIQRVRLLFPENGVANLPCMSSRLFASFTLVAEVSEGEAEERTTRRARSFRHISPILPLLKAIVNAESTSLGRQVEHRKVQFAAFDGSSTKPPKDSVIGSHIPREESIQALDMALKEVNTILATKDPKDEVTTCLTSLIEFLAKFEDRMGHTENQMSATVRTACADAMPFIWHAERFGKAASTFRNDLAKIQNCLADNKQLDDIEGSLHLEEQLVFSLGQGIRFHLRRFFNPMYFEVSLSPDLENNSLQKCNTRLSKVSEMLEMRHSKGYDTGKGSAVSDGSISSVFSLALQAVDQFFGGALFLDEPFIAPDLPACFCTSPALQLGLGTRKMPVASSEIDITNVLGEIYEAQRFLTAWKACRFILELMNWPGVQEEVKKLGGWDIVEHYADLMRQHNLSRLSPDDAHFVVLTRFDRFLPRIETCYTLMEAAAETAKVALDGIWTKFECGSTNRKRRMQYPQIKTIEEVLMEGVKMHMFPYISEPITDVDESATREKAQGAEIEKE